MRADLERKESINSRQVPRLILTGLDSNLVKLGRNYHVSLRFGHYPPQFQLQDQRNRHDSQKFLVRLDLLYLVVKFIINLYDFNNFN